MMSKSEIMPSALSAKESAGGVSFKSQCGACDRGDPVGNIDGRMVHCARDARGRAIYRQFIPCLNFDGECRGLAEPFGWVMFAWLPKRCRNGRWRWLRSVERHSDGSYTLCDRAH